MKLSILYIVTFISLTFAERFSYEGYKVYQVIPKTLSEAEVLNAFEYDTTVDFWSDVRALDLPVDIMVSPDGLTTFENILNDEGIDYSILIENVEETVRAEDLRQMISPRVARGEVSFTEYMRHDEILAYLDQLATDYPDIATTEVIGKSFEGRNLTVIKISSGGSDKPIIFIEAAIHAREWIAPPVALYIINQIVENPDNSDLYRDIDWIILPVVNPDGYEYTHTDDRFWRKTRSPGTICDGADGNRNFAYQWMLVGASNWQCSQTYAGRQAFSEVETQAVRSIFETYKGRTKVYVDVHSYAQVLLYSWGFTEDNPPDNVDELHSVGERVIASIAAVRGTNYSVGNSMTLMYPVGGGSRDFATGVGEVNLAYTLELPGGGSGGFNPDASDIIPVVTETWEGIKTLYEHIQENYVESPST